MIRFENISENPAKPVTKNIVTKSAEVIPVRVETALDATKMISVASPRKRGRPPKVEAKTATERSRDRRKGK